MLADWIILLIADLKNFLSQEESGNYIENIMN